MQVNREVSRIIERVRKEGDQALVSYLKKFDKINLAARNFAVSKKEMESACKRISPAARKALLIAKERIDFFHREELKRIQTRWSVQSHGVTVGQSAAPLDSVGIYVPGGRFCYPSTVLMTAVPAKRAGVQQVVMVTPPNQLKDEVLAAAHIARVDLCFRVGGPAAIAALAYGTRTIPKVQKIVGPGNRYVTEAKKQLFGEVGIDGLAGPSEIGVWADASADASKVALNLLAQAEHDPSSVSTLLTTQAKVRDRILEKISKNFRRQIFLKLCKSDAEIIKKINELAPEHLYLAIRNPKRVLPQIRNAGAIFLGEDTPVPLGDYAAGPSHVLPTNRTAAFSSGLSVKDFLKWSSVICVESSKARKSFEAAITIADIEGLYYHALALEASMPR